MYSFNFSEIPNICNNTFNISLLSFDIAPPISCNVILILSCLHNKSTDSIQFQHTAIYNGVIMIGVLPFSGVLLAYLV